MAKGSKRKKHRLMITVVFDENVSEAAALRIAKQAFEGDEGGGLDNKGGYVGAYIRSVSRPAT